MLPHERRSDRAQGCEAPERSGGLSLNALGSEVATYPGDSGGGHTTKYIFLFWFYSGGHKAAFLYGRAKRAKQIL